VPSESGEPQAFLAGLAFTPLGTIDVLALLLRAWLLLVPMTCAFAGDAGVIHAMQIKHISYWHLEYATRAPGRGSLAVVNRRDEVVASCGMISV
jgi:predicted outer membrane lipoprotein